MASKSVPKASRERLARVPGRPRHAPGPPRRLPRTHRDTRKSARERPTARRGDQNRRQVAFVSEKIEFSSRGAFANLFRNVFSTIVVNFGYDFRCFSRPLRASESTRCAKCRTLILTGRRGTLEGSRILPTSGKSTKNVGKNCFAQRVDSLARYNLEKRRKSTRKLTRNRRKSCLGTSGISGISGIAGVSRISGGSGISGISGSSRISGISGRDPPGETPRARIITKTPSVSEASSGNYPIDNEINDHMTTADTTIVMTMVISSVSTAEDRTSCK